MPGSNSKKRRKFRRGDLVEVRAESEIRRTLDPQGRIDGLPWIPEMAQYCGRVFRVYRRAEKVFLDHHCYVGRLRQAVLLEGVRCDGRAHGGCQMGCLLLWKEDWLRPASEDAQPENPEAAQLDAPAGTITWIAACDTARQQRVEPARLGAKVEAETTATASYPKAGSASAAESGEARRARCVHGSDSQAMSGSACPSTLVLDPCAEQTIAGVASGIEATTPGRRRVGTADATSRECDRHSAPATDRIYSCQATELIHATEPLPWWRPGQYLRDLLSGEMPPADFLRMLWLQTYNKLQRLWGGRRLGDPRGDCRRTPSESLGLKPGEWVEVKSLPEILATLDKLGRNRGLGFGPEMVQFCGRRMRVARRVERLVVEWTGRLRALSDTVALEGALCDGLAFRGCPRACYHLWREIWLRRVEEHPQPNDR